MSSEEKKPFKTVVVKYFREENDSKVRIVTTEEKWIGSAKDPVISTTFEYL